MSRRFEITMLAWTVGLGVLLLAAADAHGAEKERKGWFKRGDKSETSSSQASSSTDSGKRWWKPWGRKKQEEDTSSGWHGWRPTSSTGRFGTSGDSKPTFTTKVKKHRKGGIEGKPQERLHGAPPKKKPAVKAQPTGGTPKTNKRYERETYSRAGASLEPVKKKKVTQGGPRAYWTPPRKDTKPETYSHKNGHFRR